MYPIINTSHKNLPYGSVLISHWSIVEPKFEEFLTYSVEVKIHIINTNFLQGTKLTTLNNNVLIMLAGIHLKRWAQCTTWQTSIISKAVDICQPNRLVRTGFTTMKNSIRYMRESTSIVLVNLLLVMLNIQIHSQLYA